MKETPAILLSTSYLGPIECFTQLIRYENFYIETYENYIKQTYRNRCIIYGSNGRMALTIPVIKVNGNHTKTKDILISYRQDWQKNHWRSIVSAYNHSPFFLFYKDELEPFYYKKTKYLLDFNHQLLEAVINLLGLKIQIFYTEKYIEKKNKQFRDLRNRFTPKKENATLSFPHYTQVFEENHGFISNLSIIDLLFNAGTDSQEYLYKIFAGN
ncbi:MAG: hypothetical protein B6D61_10600 [Bacteroidetes bacterium 4484_249]|nr:MAG: hypothetical protein B6D61_10600 [Bacteroidetes bacterium 4484_249]